MNWKWPPRTVIAFQKFSTLVNLIIEQLFFFFFECSLNSLFLWEASIHCHLLSIGPSQDASGTMKWPHTVMALLEIWHFGYLIIEELYYSVARWSIWIERNSHIFHRKDQ